MVVLSPVFLPGESRGQRSLTGYSPWGCKVSDTTEQAEQQRPRRRRYMGRLSRVCSGHFRFEMPIKQASGSIERQNGDSGVKLLNHFLAL